MASSPRALRVGVLLGDNLVEERVFAANSPVSIGQSLRCQLSIPVDGVPHEHLLFAPDQGRVILRVPRSASGRLAQAGTIRTELPAGDIVLERGARGKLVLGSATLLFQEIAAPIAAPRPQLPPSVRGSLLDRVDRRLAVIVAASLLAHIGIATWAWMTELERDPSSPEALAAYEPPKYDLFVGDLVPDAPTAPSSEPGIAAPVAPSQTATPIVPNRTPGRVRNDRMPSNEDPTAWARVMAGNESGPNGQPEISNRIPGAALDSQIRDVRERNLEIGDPSHTTRELPTRIGNGPPGPTIDAPVGEHVSPKHEDAPPIRITLVPPKHPPGPPDSTLTAEMVIRRINESYMAGLQRCYRLGLTGDAGLGGRVDIEFTVTEQGATSEVSAHGLTSGVDGCIAGQMAKWRFPQPKQNGEPTDAAFKIALVLKSS
ncbi:MAG TPA: AgmX/PglI C-terminal domain-containing protein [Kofleriaceae bacterium]|nr:AgmX/PglI C-terminal domain-containing protein [Kofleriaceae bacterium]